MVVKLKKVYSNSKSYSRGVWNALFFIGCYWRTDVYKNGRSPALLFFLFCFGRGTSIVRHDQGGGLALPESCQGFCRSRYDAKNPKIGDEDSASLKTYLDASRMYDWTTPLISRTLKLSINDHAQYLISDQSETVGTVNNLRPVN